MTVPDTGGLVLEILKREDRLEMAVFEQKELTSTVRQYSHCPVSLEQVNKLCRESTVALNKIRRSDPADGDPVMPLRKAGLLFWDQLLTRPVKDRLKSASAAGLVLFLDEPLIHIPWELLYDGKDFLCLKFNLGRLIRAHGQSAPAQYRSARGNIRMLILANPTNDLKSAYQEGLDIRNQLDRRRKEISVDFKSTYIDDIYVKKNLRDYDIVHFAGHCEYDSRDPANSGWVLKDGKFTVQDIMALSESSALPALIFSNACQSAHIPSEVTPPDYQEKAYGLASAFLFAGVRHYIGAVRRIEDRVSLSFAREFYSRLVNGDPVGECMRLGRLKLADEYGMAGASWANYLLYGDPNFAVFYRKKEKSLIRPRITLRIGKKSLWKYSLIALVLAVLLGLSAWLPSVNPESYFFYARSRKLFRAGLNKEAVSVCSRVIAHDPSFLAAYPLIADASERLGKMDDALRYYFEYAFYSQKRRDRHNLAAAYIGIGWIYQLTGEYPKAYDFYEKALALSREIRNRLNEAAALRKMAVWYMDKEDFDKALELLVKSSEINREKARLPKYAYNLACDYFDIGLAFANKNDFKEARNFYHKSKMMFEKLKMTNELSDCYFNLGETYLFEKQYRKALEHYRQGLEIDRDHGDKPNLAGDYNMIGELYMEMGNLHEAEGEFKQALSICEGSNLPSELAYTCYNLGMLYRARSNLPKSREYLDRAQQLYRYIDIPLSKKVKQALADLQ